MYMCVCLSIGVYIGTTSTIIIIITCRAKNFDQSSMVEACNAALLYAHRLQANHQENSHSFIYYYLLLLFFLLITLYYSTLHSTRDDSPIHAFVSRTGQIVPYREKKIIDHSVLDLSSVETRRMTAIGELIIII